MSGFGNLMPLIPAAEQDRSFKDRRMKNWDEEQIAREVTDGALPFVNLASQLKNADRSR